MNPTVLGVDLPAAQNGWYASPTVTLTGEDGAGVGDRPHLVQDRRRGDWHTYTGPLSGFSTGNHFVQFQATDVAGRVESAVNLVAFKADAVKPSVNITRPADGASYPLDKVVTAAYKCTDSESGIDILRRHGRERREPRHVDGRRRTRSRSPPPTRPAT